MKVWCIKVL